MQHFGSSFSGRGRRRVLNISPEELFDSLYALAMETEMGDGIVANIAMPPGWEAFLTRWIARTINFLIHRRCRGGKY